MIHPSCLPHLSALKMSMDILTASDNCFVVGDVHGDLNQFLQPLCEFLRNYSENGNHHLIYLGDYIDRGEYDAYIYCLIKTIENAKLPQNAHITFIRGNHEQLKTNPDLYMRFKGADKDGTLFNRHFLTNESFVWNLFNKHDFPLYHMLRTAPDQVLLFTHAPVLTASKAFNVDVSTGELRVKSINKTSHNDSLYGYEHFTTLDANFDRVNKKYRSSMDDFVNTVNASINEATMSPSLSSKINVKNIFGHIHAFETEAFELLNKYMKGADMNDIVNGFVCLDIDASYGFRLREAVWKKTDETKITKQDRDKFDSRVYYLKIVNGKGELRHRITIPKGSERGNTGVLNFNNVKTLDELIGKMMSCDEFKRFDNVFHWNSAKMYLKDVADELKLQLDALKGDRRIGYDDLIYDNYVKAFNANNKRFVKYGQPNEIIKLFNNVPSDVIRAAGYDSEYSFMMPFEIFVSIIDSRIKTSTDADLQYSWVFEAMNGNGGADAEFKGGFSHSDIVLFKWFEYALLAVVSVLTIIIFYIGYGTFKGRKLCSRNNDLRMPSYSMPLMFGSKTN